MKGVTAEILLNYYGGDSVVNAISLLSWAFSAQTGIMPGFSGLPNWELLSHDEFRVENYQVRLNFYVKHTKFLFLKCHITNAKLLTSIFKGSMRMSCSL